MIPREPDSVFESYIANESEKVIDAARRAYYSMTYSILFPGAYDRYEVGRPTVTGVADSVHEWETMVRAEKIVGEFERNNLEHVRQYFGIKV